MQELLLIGIGTGSPDHLTRGAEAAIRSADLVLIPRKGAEKDDLAEIRRAILRVVAPQVPAVEFDLPRRDRAGDYLRRVTEWHDRIAEAWRAALPADAGRVALLVWGDPSLYDSTLRIAERLDPRPKVTVVPGITALQALTAAHAIPLNDLNSPVVITTGRRLRDHGWPAGADTVAVLLDGECSFRTLEPAGVRIWWGAFLGMAEEVLVSGALSEVAETIAATREVARERHGWIMDIYLIRRQGTAETE